MHPRISGQGVFPRYGGGWMHQFGHVYALQQELLNPEANNWSRAIELWNVARHEGVAMNSAHYTNILRQCVPPAAWETSLMVLKQMRREGIRPDVIGVGCALAACADAKRAAEVEKIFAEFSAKMKLDSICYLALIKAKMSNNKWDEALSVGRKQEADGVPFLPNTYSHLLEAANEMDSTPYALTLAGRMIDDGWCVPARGQLALKKLCMRHDLKEEYIRLTGDGDTDEMQPLLRGVGE